MAKKRCIACTGSGRVMGGGMMMQDCDDCDGTGKIYIDDPELEFNEMKATKAYKNAIDKIKNTDKNLSDEAAENIFKDEFIKLGNNKDKKN